MSDVLSSALVGLQQVVAWPNLGLMLAGITLGFVVGLLPGLGGPTALALLLPLTIPLEPAGAFALLIGVAAVTGTAGDITSILLGVPGEGTAAAVVLDGHAMTRKGQAARALGAAMGASFIGGIVGILALLLMLPVIYPVIAAIQSPELAALALAGMCLAAPPAGNSWRKVMIAAGVGLLLSAVGLEPRFGLQRFTFGELFLRDGIGLMSLALGLFAIPEAVTLLAARAADRGTVQPTGRQVRQGLNDVLARPGLVLRSALLGSGIGVVPGVGASVSQWLAYSGAARAVPRGERLGTGRIEGVIAPCAATNATLGGALVPAVTLGIPGSLSTTFLLGALVMKGLTPGVTLLTPDNEGGRLSIVFAIAWLLLLSNVAASMLGLASFKGLTRVLQVPGRFLFPFVASFILLGAFAERSAPEDVGIVAVIGVFGWLMARCDWPRAPMVMGLVLGPLVERRVALATSLHGLSWVVRPGVLLVLVVLVLAGARMGVSGRRAAGDDAKPASTSQAGRSEAVLVWAFLALMVSAWLAAGGFRWEIAVLPRIVAAVCTPLLLWEALRLTRRHQRAAVSDDLGSSHGVARREGLTALAWLFALAVSVGLLGFGLGCGVWSVCYLRVSGPTSWRRSVMVASALTLATALVLKAINTSAAEGWLWRLL